MDDHTRPHPSPMTGEFLEFDLSAEITRLLGEKTSDSGQHTRMLIKYDDLRVVLIAMEAHARMAEHKTGGRISIHVLSGHIVVGAAGRTFDLRAGGLLALDQAVPHDVEALEESAFLLTFAWPKAPPQGA